MPLAGQVLDILGLQHPHPEWAADGQSILPLLLGGEAPFQRNSSLVWRLGSQVVTCAGAADARAVESHLCPGLALQVALLEPTGQYKLVYAPTKGQCALEAASYSGVGPFLFDLVADPTESAPVTDQPQRLADMEVGWEEEGGGGGRGGMSTARAAEAVVHWCHLPPPPPYSPAQAAMAAFQASIPVSQMTESRCLPPANGSSTQVLLQRGTGPASCLAAVGTANESPVNGTGSCAAAASSLNRWLVNATAGGAVALASVPTQCFHTDNAAPAPCAAGTSVHLGDRCGNAMRYDPGSGSLVQPGCPGMCAAAAGAAEGGAAAGAAEGGAAAGAAEGGGALELVACTDARATGWVARNATATAGAAASGLAGSDGVDGTRWTGAYLRPFD